MAKTTKLIARLKLRARIRNKRKTTGYFAARIALIERISGLPGIETFESNDQGSPGRVEIYLRGDDSDRALKRKPAPKICSLDFNGITVSGLNRWDRYQVLANGWGKLTNDQICVYLPRDHTELEIVWSVVRQAYNRLCGASSSGSPEASTWNFPGFSRTSLQ